jgi:serine/threonine-protein kinase
LRVGRYEIQEELARGGMGAVWRAHDTAFQRTVALKVLLASPQKQSELKQRFLEEAQVLGQLQHPGIPPVHDLGELPDGRPFFAMKLIQGRTLAQFLRERSTPAHELPRFLGIFGQVCQTVAYAHSRGILHRDLKPSNLMVGAFGEVQVMDWGLAKALASGEREPPETSSTQGADTPRSPELPREDTREGTVLGTPAYMAPEQARGEIERLDERCDVFGLGAILCVILTGQPPYVGSTSAAVLQQAQRANLDEAFARLHGSGADPEVVALTRRCLAAAPEGRLRDAGAVAAELTAYLESVARRLKDAELARAAELVRLQEAQATAAQERKARRLTVALAAVVLLVVVLVGGGWLWLEQVRQQRQNAVADLINKDLDEAHDARARARNAAVGDLTNWEKALAAVDHARGRLAGEEDYPELLQRVDEFGAILQAEMAAAKRDADAAERDRKLLDRLSQIRSRKADVFLPTTEKGQLVLGGNAEAEYAAAFREYGVDVAALPATEAAAHFRKRPEAVVVEVAAALDDWAFERRRKKSLEASWRHPLEVAMQADPDKLRVALRQAMASGDMAALRKVAAGKLDGLPVASLALLGFLLENAGDRDAAIRWLKRAQLRYPGDLWINYALGQSLRLVQPPRLGQALQYYRVVRALRPEMGLPLAYLLLREKQTQEALALFQQLIDLQPSNPWHQVGLGVALIEINEPGRAIEQFKRALDLDPRFAQAYSSWGTALYGKGDLEGAIACFRKALDLDPQLVQAHYNLGLTLAGKKDLEGAVACFRKALDLDPQLVQAHYNLGLALYKKKDPERASACFRKALDLDPKLAAAHNNLGLILWDRNDLEGALKHYTRARDLDPKSAEAWNNVGAVLYEKKDREGALKHYRKALELDPRSADAYVNLGRALQAQKDLEGALALLQKAVECAPRFAPARLYLGAALFDKKDVPGAIASYRKAVELDPDYLQAHVALGAAYYQLKDLKQAIASHQKALKLDPKLLPARLGLAVALYDQKDYEGAINHYNKALEVDANAPIAHQGLAMALLRSGRFAEARDAFRKVLDQRPPSDPRRKSLTTLYQLAEQLQRVDDRLADILKGKSQPKNTAEQLALADLCQQYKKLYTAATRFYTAALAAKPPLPAPEQARHRYNAACSAALAAAGQGRDADKLDAREKTRLRRQALAWLRENLKQHNQEPADGDARALKELSKTLQDWRTDEDLASVRDPEALARLSETEQASWRQLWADVEGLLKKVSSGTDP